MLAVMIAAAQTTNYVPPPPEQPLPYSHKQHLAQGLACKDCHAMPDPGDRATLPATSKCMTCHIEVKKTSPAIQKLAEYHKKGEEIPWKRVYRVPDFVSFSHKAHVTKAKVECETCHGPVRERDVIRKESDISMGGCIDCHRNAGAPVACDFCHEEK